MRNASLFNPTFVLNISYSIYRFMESNKTISFYQNTILSKSKGTNENFPTPLKHLLHLLFLLISPPDRPGDHLRALENISRQLRDDTFCRFLASRRLYNVGVGADLHPGKKKRENYHREHSGPSLALRREGEGFRIADFGFRIWETP